MLLLGHGEAKKLVMFRLIELKRLKNSASNTKKLGLTLSRVFSRGLDNVACSPLSCNVGSRRRRLERLKGENIAKWCSDYEGFSRVGSFGRMNKSAALVR